MCDVMPTISEDSISQRSSQFGDDANFEQLMVSMLDERDKLVDSLKNEQEKTSELEVRVKELEKERDSLNRQLNQNLPQVSHFQASIFGKVVKCKKPTALAVKNVPLPRLLRGCLQPLHIALLIGCSL